MNLEYTYFKHPAYKGLAHTIDVTDKRHIKWEEQFRTLGYDDTYFWNLDITITQFIYPLLVNFKDPDIDDDNELYKELDKVIKLFKPLYDNPDESIWEQQNQIDAYQALSEIIPRLWT